jgi:hypothetical protein
LWGCRQAYYLIEIHTTKQHKKTRTYGDNLWATGGADLSVKSSMRRHSHGDAHCAVIFTLPAIPSRICRHWRSLQSDKLASGRMIRVWSKDREIVPGGWGTVSRLCWFMVAYLLLVLAIVLSENVSGLMEKRLSPWSLSGCQTSVSPARQGTIGLPSLYVEPRSISELGNYSCPMMLRPLVGNASFGRENLCMVLECGFHSMRPRTLRVKLLSLLGCV